jgi:UDP-N-acetylmuramoyl-tripeptide--D-alanyl-D-alanine ligase
MMALLETAMAVSGQPVGDNVTFDSVSSDSRTVPPGALFVALRGEKFDGHAFLKGAKDKGAVAALVDQAYHASGERAPLPLVVVPDTLMALGLLAAHWRARHSVPVVGVVGSNGKTTVKEMIAAVLRAHYGAGEVLATEGNLNNDIGLPLTVLKLRAAHRAAVIEIGMNHPGETAKLARIARPSVGLVNNAQREHQEFMKSVEDVAHEHASLIGALPHGGVAVVNADDDFAPLWREKAAGVGATVRDFSLGGAAAVSARTIAKGFANDISLALPEGHARFTIELPGLHNARNAAGAAAAATAAGASVEAVERGLAGFTGVKGRQQRKQSRGGAVVIDDTYNANPESVRAAIEVLGSCTGPTTLVLGDMGEVGEKGPEFHEEIGAYARSMNIGALYGLGTLMRHAVDAYGEGARHAASLDELLGLVGQRDTAGATLLVKGSRFMRMERVVEALTGSSGGTH